MDDENYEIKVYRLIFIYKNYHGTKIQSTI